MTVIALKTAIMRLPRKAKMPSAMMLRIARISAYSTNVCPLVDFHSDRMAVTTVCIRVLICNIIGNRFEDTSVKERLQRKRMGKEENRPINEIGQGT